MNEVRTSRKLILLALLGAAFLLVIIRESGIIRASDKIVQTEVTADSKKNSAVINKKTIKQNGQTMLDVSRGDIRITLNGAAGGGLDENETSLNPKGYWITGDTTQHNVIVEENVSTQITLDSVNITCDWKKMSCIDVSHADVTITLVGENNLLCNAGTSENLETGGTALTKEGMDDHTLTIQCEHADENGHQCDKKCGSLLAKGAQDMYHAGAIGSSMNNKGDTKKTGFANLKIKGGNIEALAGMHTPGIGSACVSESRAGGYTKNIWITGGNVKATGTSNGSGIGSGYGNKVDGIYITGGVVEATGGKYAPGIGSPYSVGVPTQSGITQNVKISGGNTIVTAIGDSETNMPGIGSGDGNSKVSNVTASPDSGYQGYIQDGTSLTDYAFMDGTPFHSETDISVGKFYTKVYFGPYRDKNKVDNVTKEQIGANHIISKSGGTAFTEEQLKILSRVTGKKKDGTEYLLGELSIADKSQMEAINQAKTKGKTGEFPLTFQTNDGTEVEITVFLRENGTDGLEYDPLDPSSVIGADNFAKETGGTEWTEDDVKKFAGLKGKDSEGNDIALDDFSLDQEQLDEINKTKTAGKAGESDLKFTDPEGNSVTVQVTLTGEFDQITENPANHEIVKAQNVISRTGGNGFTEEQLKDLSQLRAVDELGNEIKNDKLHLSDNAQLERINKAKESGETGEFPLTFTTENGTEVTVSIFLRDEGTDGTDHRNGSASIAANHASHETGGDKFSKEEIIALCGVKGKNQYGDTIPVKIDEKQLETINHAKQAGNTGVFPMTFSMSDGTSVTVKVTLTGEHKVVFDPNGGDYKPKDQTVIGGEKVKRPKDPKREGYTFEGWYYTDEDGKEQKWDFDDTLNRGIELKAKWKKDSGISNNTENTKDSKKEMSSSSKKQTSKKVSDKKEGTLPDWGQYQIKGRDSEKGGAAETSDKKMLFQILMLLAASGSIGTGLLLKRYVRTK